MMPKYRKFPGEPRMTKPPLRIIREGDAPPPGGRPQDPHLDGRDLKFETLEHGGAERDTMPNAIRITDPQGRSAVYVLKR